MILRLFTTIVAISLLFGLIERVEAEPVSPQTVIATLAGTTAQPGNSAMGAVSDFHHDDLQVQTSQDSYREIHLHPGTVIDPRGATLRPGMSVAVSGQTMADGSLDATVVNVLR